MQFLVLSISADEAHPPAGGYKVGYASCWIDEPDPDRALEKASRLAAEHGWRVEELVENYEIAEGHYSEDSEGFPYYQQALTDGEVVVLYVVKPSD